MWGICFGEFQCLPVDDCSAVSCDSGVLARGSESTSFYSAILVQGLNLYILKGMQTYFYLLKTINGLKEWRWEIEICVNENFSLGYRHKKPVNYSQFEDSDSDGK